MKPQPPPRSEAVSIEFEGKTYSATYSVSKGMLTVTSPMLGSKSATPGAGPEVLARLLLRELLQDAKRAGTLT